MIQTFTQNDIVRFIYNEVSLEEKKEIQKALLWDNELAECYQELLATKKAVSKVKREPSQRVIDNILNFSRSLPSLGSKAFLNTTA